MASDRFRRRLEYSQRPGRIPMIDQNRATEFMDRPYWPESESSGAAANFLSRQRSIATGGDSRMHNVLAVVLAGGKGSRLEPLTRDRAKPAVPFGGLYRIIDFALSNCLHSNLRGVLVLTQYKARSLDRHIAAGWNFLSKQLDEY